ncbi:MAG: Phosphoenolpyruvate-dependent phosphotransferase system [Candidatus Celerinatantimonas neptuna]|nr:MAG: Phosphoenolpyruvate-dependent phosphotransferase system [Candidatus Celerinatantimonas neptuna]
MLAELRRVVEKVGQAPSFDAAMQLLVSEIRVTMQVDCCSVYQADHDQQQLILRASDGLAQSAVGRARIKFDEGVVGLVARREEPLNIADVHNHPSFKYLPEAEEDSFNSFLGTPIIYQRELLGVLVVQQFQTRSFIDTEEAFLVTLAAHLSAVFSQVENVQKVTQPRVLHSSFKGIAGSQGIAMARSLLFQSPSSLGEQELETTTQIDDELTALDKAIEQTHSDVQKMMSRLGTELPQDVLSIFEVYQGMLNDAGFLKALRLKIKQGYTAVSALQLVRDDYLSQFEAMSDTYLRERAIDLRDLCQRIYTHLSRPHSIVPKQGKFVLVAEEVTATMLGDFPKSQLMGFISQRGAANSHAAILARAMGIPAVLGFTAEMETLDRQLLIVDGYQGLVFVSPDAILRSEYRQLLRDEEEINAQINRDLEQVACTLDGYHLELLINAGLSSDADRAESKSDGVGLYRTEVPFLLQNRFPSETEQFQSYLRILNRFKGKPVCMRTLDVGGDKQLPYFPIQEENPFLGWRGIRMTLDHPEIFLVQCRAMYRASLSQSNLSIMLPMISSIGEVERATQLLDRAWNEVLEEVGHSRSVTRPALGVMLEVPSALWILPELAKRVSFWSVGTNDLTQYLLAVDRSNAHVSGLYSTYHPAVVRALNFIIRQGKELNVSLSVCGEMAGEPLGVLMLLVLGYRRLSMSSFNLARIKYLIRRISIAELEALKEPLLASETPEEVAQLLQCYLESKDLMQLVRLQND